MDDITAERLAQRRAELRQRNVDMAHAEAAEAMANPKKRAPPDYRTRDLRPHGTKQRSALLD